MPITKVTATVVSQFEVTLEGWILLYLNGITLRLKAEDAAALAAGACTAHDPSDGSGIDVFMTDTELVVGSVGHRRVFVFAAGIGPVLRRALETVGRA